MGVYYVKRRRQRERDCACACVVVCISRLAVAAWCTGSFLHIKPIERRFVCCSVDLLNPLVHIYLRWMQQHMRELSANLVCW
jgi:hypothetical protein